MKKNIFDKLFVLEMANNHDGSVEHGLKIIKQMAKVCKKYPMFKFAFKFQFRNLDTFIHPDYQNRKDIKYIKRFTDSRISRKDYQTLFDEAKKQGFITMCTPFDEPSVDLVMEMGFDIIKVASASFQDWPLLTKIVACDKPIVLSCATASLEEIDNVVNFFKNRNRTFALMHCVADYPTKTEKLQLNQIDVLKKLYPEIPIGFSTHEDPAATDIIPLAVAKGAKIFEKHVNVKEEGFSINGYSSTDDQVDKWLAAAEHAFEICGSEDGTRYQPSETESASIKNLSRGVWAKEIIKKGEKITLDKIFLAMPTFEGQLTARDLSKYSLYTAKEDIKPQEPVYKEKLNYKNIHKQVAEIVTKIQDLIEKANIVVPNHTYFELSHHYGIDRFYEIGATIIDCINREYCKKLLILLPNQKHPCHYHQKKEETFLVVYGDLTLELDGEIKHYKKGDMVLVKRGQKHSFATQNGLIFEEISTTHYKNDSFYDDANIMENKNRKTAMILNCKVK